MKWLLALLLIWNGVKVSYSDEEWRARLGRERFCVMRKKATELPFSGLVLHFSEPGIYFCAACELALFRSSDKFDMNNGWPCFREPIVQKHVRIREDFSLGFRRYEVLCRACDSHLGHVFRSDARLRYTINSIALEFQAGKIDSPEKGDALLESHREEEPSA